MNNILTTLIEEQYQNKAKRDIWENSPYKNIKDLENDDVGKLGEKFIQELCNKLSINAKIDGISNKKRNGGDGDGTILNKTVEIKTARAGSGRSITFQHELGEKPWKAKYMLFIDIEPNSIYITIFPNFSEEFYKESGADSNIKCEPIFPTKSICWRKRMGAFKLDTTPKINENNNYTLKWTPELTDTEIKEFITKIIN